MALPFGVNLSPLQAKSPSGRNITSVFVDVDMCASESLPAAEVFLVRHGVDSQLDHDFRCHSRISCPMARAVLDDGSVFCVSGTDNRNHLFVVSLD